MSVELFIDRNYFRENESDESNEKKCRIQCKYCRDVWMMLLSFMENLPSPFTGAHSTHSSFKNDAQKRMLK